MSLMQPTLPQTLKLPSLHPHFLESTSSPPNMSVAAILLNVCMLLTSGCTIGDWGIIGSPPKDEKKAEKLKEGGEDKNKKDVSKRAQRERRR